MHAVSDTSVISNLASIGRLKLLRDQFQNVWIPQAVFTELSAHPNAAARDAINQALLDGWLTIRKVGASAVLSDLKLQVDPGEAEAIALALESSSIKILIDEKDGRRLALRHGVSVVGVLGILLEAKRSEEERLNRFGLRLKTCEAEAGSIWERASFKPSSRLQGNNKVTNARGAEMFVRG